MAGKLLNKLLDEQKQASSGARLFDLNKQPPAENWVLNIGGKKVGSLGNFITISGLPKARKTVFAHAMIASAISGSTCLGLSMNLPENKRDVVLLDCEQSENSLWNAMQRAKQMGKWERFPENMRVWYLRKCSPAENMEILEKECARSKTGLIIIDGLLNFIIDFNNVEESHILVKKLMNLVDTYNVMIVNILHISKSTNFTVGHLGSLCDRYTQSTLEVVKLENGDSELKAKYMRDDENFEPVTIYWNHNIENYSVSPSGSYFEDDNLEDVNHGTYIDRIFASNDEQDYTNLIKRVKLIYGKTETFARKKLIPFLLENRYIEKIEGKYKKFTNPF